MKDDDARKPNSAQSMYHECPYTSHPRCRDNKRKKQVPLIYKVHDACSRCPPYLIHKIPIYPVGRSSVSILFRSVFGDA